MLFSAFTIGMQQQIKLYPLLKGVAHFSYGLHIGLSMKTIGYFLCPVEKCCF